MPHTAYDRRLLPADLPPVVTTALRLISASLVIAALYAGQDLLLPLALAALLAFLLDPAVTRLQRWRMPRRWAVGVVAGLTVLALGAASFVIAQQVAVIGQGLPRYQTTIEKKLRDLRASVTRDSALNSATRLLGTVEVEVDKTRQALQDKAAPASAAKPQPVRVMVAASEASTLDTVADLTRPVVGPLLMGGVVFVLLVFILLERDDIRDRLLYLSWRDLPGMTDTLNEAANRVSRYLRLSLLLNFAYGLPLALGLWAIGVPGAWLWGVLAALLRFVPYLGPVTASMFPLALAFAVDPGWDMLMWTLALVLVLELVSNNVLEPWVLGSSTGLAPLAMLLSAAFWTLLWGPIGLVLATPLTVCLVVLGRQLPALRFLEVLLGSGPAFDAPTRLFQRLLSGKVEASLDVAEQQIADGSLLAFYSGTALPALAMAGGPGSELSTADHRQRVCTSMALLVRELRQDHPAPSDDAPQVHCVGLRWEIDHLAADMAAHALQLQGVPAVALPAGQAVPDAGTDTVPRLIFLTTYHRDPEALVRHACAQLRRRHPQALIGLGLWGAPASLRDPQAAQRLGVQFVATTLDQAVQHLGSSLGVTVDVAVPLPTAPVASEAPAASLVASAPDQPRTKDRLPLPLQAVPQATLLPLALLPGQQPPRGVVLRASSALSDGQWPGLQPHWNPGRMP